MSRDCSMQCNWKNNHYPCFKKKSFKKIGFCFELQGFISHIQRKKKTHTFFSCSTNNIIFLLSFEKVISPDVIIACSCYVIVPHVSIKGSNWKTFLNVIMQQVPPGDNNNSYSSGGSSSHRELRVACGRRRGPGKLCSPSPCHADNSRAWVDEVCQLHLSHRLGESAWEAACMCTQCPSCQDQQQGFHQQEPAASIIQFFFHITLGPKFSWDPGWGKKERCGALHPCFLEDSHWE